MSSHITAQPADAEMTKRVRPSTDVEAPPAGGLQSADSFKLAADGKSTSSSSSDNVAKPEELVKIDTEPAEEAEKFADVTYSDIAKQFSLLGWIAFGERLFWKDGPFVTSYPSRFCDILK